MWSSYEELQELLEGVLDTLSPLEREVLSMRFGLDGGNSHTLKEVGECFGMTDFDIRVVEAKALRRARKVPHRIFVVDDGATCFTEAERQAANRVVWEWAGRFCCGIGGGVV